MPESYENAVVRLRNKYDVNVNRLDHLKGAGIGVVGGGAAGLALGRRVKNPVASAAVKAGGFLSGAVGGAALNPHSLRAKKFSDELKAGIAANQIEPEINRIPDDFINARAADLLLKKASETMGIRVLFNR